MVHNGIEYGMVASLAEGLNTLRNADADTASTHRDAETAPMEQPQFYQFDIDTTAVTEVWRRGSVIESWLLDLTAAALVKSPDLDEYAGRVSDSGEGRCTSIAAIEEGVPAPVLTTALLPVRLPRFGRLRRQGAVRHAPRLRRARREADRGNASARVDAVRTSHPRWL